jgi:hypothetical protein
MANSWNYMKKKLVKLRLILTFYRSYFFASFLITLAFSYLFWLYGFSIFATLFWGKIITLFIIYNFIRSYKNKEFYYYQNLGLSKKVLWTSTLIFDMLLYLFVIVQVNKFR